MLKNSEEIIRVDLTVMVKSGSVKKSCPKRENQKVEWLKIQADKENILKRCQNVCEIRKLIYDNYMLPECQKGYLEFTDLDTISERLENHKILRYIYRNRSKQWIALSAIVQNRDKNGRVTDILFLTHDVTGVSCGG